eukprot:CAMPEP_0118977062 /NCGR_PEP_ID=MMETSP1173-20130426/20446_1 /TAXON_ID=1034831 /ORGANISM="Rhizochromulina marina cf, Strain CCMP1243" /LENGTH=86 /DNA_ID=CAMNT_0006927139 /DNA_START=30 /DNA_END=287 /DNA_ORIENTATION=-
MSHCYKKLLVENHAMRRLWETCFTLLDATPPFFCRLVLGLKTLSGGGGAGRGGGGGKYARRSLVDHDSVETADQIISATPLLKFTG